MNTDKATPRPWNIESYYAIWADKVPIAQMISHGKTEEATKANAALIVKAVNLHDELVKALRDHVDMFEVVANCVKWGETFLNAEAISAWNDAEVQARKVLQKVERNTINVEEKITP